MTDYLLQQGREKYFKHLDLVKSVHSKYAEQNGLEYIVHRGKTCPGWYGTWDSVPLMLDLAKRKDTGYIFWFDADVVIVGDEDPRDALGNCLVGMTRHPGPPEHYNCGVMFLWACPQVVRFLQKVLDSGPGVYPWYQQNFYNEYLVGPAWVDRVKTLDHKWNSTVVLDHPEAGCIVRAWHGFDGDRYAEMRRYIKARGATP